VGMAVSHPNAAWEDVIGQFGQQAYAEHHELLTSSFCWIRRRQDNPVAYW